MISSERANKSAAANRRWNNSYAAPLSLIVCHQFVAAVKFGNYMLAKQIEQHGFFAAVSVSYDDTVGGVAVELAESARQSSFGAAALQGVRYALAHCSPAVGSSVGRITVTTIEDLPVDTTPPAVAFAACYAAWSALDRKPTSEPRFDGLQIIFAD